MYICVAIEKKGRWGGVTEGDGNIVMHKRKKGYRSEGREASRM